MSYNKVRNKDIQSEIQVKIIKLKWNMSMKKYTITDIGNHRLIFKLLLRQFKWKYTEYSLMIGKQKQYYTQRLNSYQHSNLSQDDLYRLKYEVNLKYGKGVFEEELNLLMIERKENLRDGKVFEELLERIEILEKELEDCNKNK